MQASIKCELRGFQGLAIIWFAGISLILERWSRDNAKLITSIKGIRRAQICNVNCWQDYHKSPSIFLAIDKHANLHPNSASAKHATRSRSALLLVSSTIDIRGGALIGNNRTVLNTVCINHPILHLWDFGKDHHYILHGKKGTFQPIKPLLKFFVNLLPILHCMLPRKAILCGGKFL